MQMTEERAGTNTLVTWRQAHSTANSPKPHSGGWDSCVQVGRPTVTGKGAAVCGGDPSSCLPTTASWGESEYRINAVTWSYIDSFFRLTNGSDGGITKWWLKYESNAFKSNYSSETRMPASREQIIRGSNHYLLNRRNSLSLMTTSFTLSHFDISELGTIHLYYEWHLLISSEQWER